MVFTKRTHHSVRIRNKRPAGMMQVRLTGTTLDWKW
jgi:hypothetical protein